MTFLLQSTLTWDSIFDEAVNSTENRDLPDERSYCEDFQHSELHNRETPRIFEINDC